MTSRDAMGGGRSETPSDGGDIRPGDGYRIEIQSVRRILKPLEESVVAAHKLKNEWKSLHKLIQNSATFEIEDAAESVLSSWGYGLGRVGAHTDTVVETLRQVIAAYMLADLLRVKDFSPTADNMAKLPFGEAGLKAWENGYRPTFDPPPEIYQEPWLDDGDSTVTGDPPTNPRKLYDGGWVTDGGSKGKIA